MKNISLKLPETLLQGVEKRAELTGRSKSEVMRDAIAQYLQEAQADSGNSVFDAAADLLGCVAGPGDLSHNPKYMENFGR